MHLKAAGLTALLILIWSPLAAAGPVVDAATKAEALAAEGKTVEALDALDQAADAVWTAGPLAFRKVVLVDSTSEGGIYEARSDSTFKPDDKLSVYVEPVGYGYGDGSIGFTADLALKNATGQTLSETADVFSLSAPLAAGRRELSLTISFKVPFLRPGDYTAIITMHDQNSDKSGRFEVPFSVVLPTAE